MEVSVLYVTNRLGGIDVLKGNLERQTFQDFEVVMVDGQLRDMTLLTSFLVRLGSRLRQFAEPPRKDGTLTNIWAAYNKGLSKCQGKYVVFLQDYIWIPPGGIGRFVRCQERQRGFYTGVGNVGEGPEKTVDGALTIWGYPYYGPPERIRWQDPRIGAWDGQVVKVDPDMWENNWACAPRSALLELGGFDEEFDFGWAWGEKDLAFRALKLGYKSYMDTGNRCMAWWHDTFWPNPYKDNETLSNKPRLDTKLAEMAAGKRSARLNYLENRDG
jgi:glycosyltransferase involved in cell wall biosynthesis